LSSANDNAIFVVLHVTDVGLLRRN